MKSYIQQLRDHAVETRRCPPRPFGCGGLWGDFRDELSRKEAQISGLCQECQDNVFAEPGEFEHVSWQSRMSGFMHLVMADLAMTTAQKVDRAVGEKIAKPIVMLMLGREHLEVAGYLECFGWSRDDAYEDSLAAMKTNLKEAGHRGAHLE